MKKKLRPSRDGEKLNNIIAAIVAFLVAFLITLLGG